MSEHDDPVMRAAIAHAVTKPPLTLEQLRALPKSEPDCDENGMSREYPGMTYDELLEFEWDH